MRCAHALSTSELSRAAAVEAAELIAHKLDGRTVDLLMCFYTADHLDKVGQIASYLRQRLNPACLVGVSAEGVLAGGREVERSPGLALWAAHLPGCRIKGFEVDIAEWEGMLGSGEGADVDRLLNRVTIPGMQLIMVFGDPFSTPADALLGAFDMHLPSVPVVGGMASGATQPGTNRLILNGDIRPSGIVGATIAGPIRLDTIVSQGCKPIGKPLVVTQAKSNVLIRLDDRPALAALEDLIEGLPNEERQKLGNGVFIGRAISDKDRLGRGDFLIRGVIGVDRDTGAMAIGDRIDAGVRVQFHVRDAVTAREDLELMLTPQAFEQAPPIGALLFSCNGRGRRLYDQPDVDATLVTAGVGPSTPVAGFFAAGEFGPVGGFNFIHGHSACVAMLRPA